MLKYTISVGRARKVMGATVENLAEVLGVSVDFVEDLEQREARGLANSRELAIAAAALGFDYVGGVEMTCEEVYDCRQSLAFEGPGFPPPKRGAVGDIVGTAPAGGIPAPGAGTRTMTTSVAIDVPIDGGGVSAAAGDLAVDCANVSNAIGDVAKQVGDSAKAVVDEYIASIFRPHEGVVVREAIDGIDSAVVQEAFARFTAALSKSAIRNKLSYFSAVLRNVKYDMQNKKNAYAPAVQAPAVAVSKPHKRNMAVARQGLQSMRDISKKLANPSGKSV